MRQLNSSAVSSIFLLLLSNVAAFEENKCPPFICRMWCEFGNIVEDGCKVCACNKEPPSCDVGEAWDSTSLSCVAVSCASPRACDSDPSTTCQSQEIVCEQEPCPQFTCLASSSPQCGVGEEYDTLLGKCVPVSCESPSACDDGKTCHPGSLVCARSPCPQFTCEAGCAQGEEYDIFTNQCVPVSCESPDACDDGDLCQPEAINCFRAPCPQFSCQKPPTPTCGPGEDYDLTQKQCIPVSCDAPNACDDGDTCETTSVVCARSLCPQFQCKAKPSCLLGEAFDDLIDSCVPVSCDSEGACPQQQCVPEANIRCFRPPCPQYRCEAKPVAATCQIGEVMVSGKCRAVSCESSLACQWQGGWCTSRQRTCFLRSYCPQFTCHNIWW